VDGTVKYTAFTWKSRLYDDMNDPPLENGEGGYLTLDSCSNNLDQQE